MESVASSSFKFSNLLGTVYRQGNIVFSQDGNSVFSPVGNRVTVFDLVNNKSHTFGFQNKKNIGRIALSPDGTILISVDEEGKALVVNIHKGVVLHHWSFKKPVQDIKFSPDGKFIAVTHGSVIQVWYTPSAIEREFAAFKLHRHYAGHYNDILSITWSSDSRCILTTSKDMTAKLFTVYNVEGGYKPKTFAGHRDYVLNAYFSNDNKTIYTVSRDGAVFTWKAKQDEAESEDEEQLQVSTEYEPGENTIAKTRWGVYERNYFHQPNGVKTVCSAFHSKSSLLVAGFSSGVFGLWEMPTFTSIHTLSISNEKITSVVLNPSGEWLAFGAKKMGQLLVWEWQSESYVLKQQGHYYDMNTIAYSPDGQQIVTGGDDGKLKVWNSVSGFCFLTFSDHSAPISTVEFAKQGQVIFSASLDGTVRAYDLIRYRNFRTFTTPSPVQFTSLAVDPSGEIVCAGGTGDGFEIYMWSTQTGKLIDILVGHTAPVASLAFSPLGDRLASASWDKSVRVWDCFGRSTAVEPFNLNSDALSVTFRPDGQEIAVSSLDGQISFFDIKNGRQRTMIEGRKDISGGRKIEDRTTAKNNSSGKSFNSLCYTADGSSILAGGNSKYVCLYDCRDGVLLKRYTISENFSLDGTQEFLDSRLLTEAGHVDLIDERGDASDLEDRIDMNLPGKKGGDKSKRRYRPDVRTKCIRIGPTGRTWAAASTEGLLVYSLDNNISFDPFDLEMNITPESIVSTVTEQQYLKALVMSLRLNEYSIIQSVYEAIPPSEVKLIAQQLPEVYLENLMKFIAQQMEKSPHAEFHLIWVTSLFQAHGKHLFDQSGQHVATFRSIAKGLMDFQKNVLRLMDDNTFTLQYLVDQLEWQKVDSSDKMEL